VLVSVAVSCDGGQTFARRGTVAGIVPGSQLEEAYGGTSNLSAVIPVGDPKRSPEAAPSLSKEAFAN
jgi:hypothetical protein